MTTDTLDRYERWLTTVLHTAPRWPALAAAPTFGIMALLTGVHGYDAVPMCAAMQDGSPLGGMAWMYALMSAFHSGAWLKLISGRH